MRRATGAPMSHRTPSRSSPQSTTRRLSTGCDTNSLTAPTLIRDDRPTGCTATPERVDHRSSAGGDGDSGGYGPRSSDDVATAASMATRAVPRLPGVARAAMQGWYEHEREVLGLRGRERAVRANHTPGGRRARRRRPDNALSGA